MEDDAIEALEGLKSGSRHGLIAVSRDDTKVIDDMRNALCQVDIE
jgi:hypothetical protein